MVAGEPFVGESGRLLWSAAGQAAILKSRVLVCNVVEDQPAGNDWNAHLPGAVKLGVARLHKELAAYPRKLIVALGEQALLAALGEEVPEKEAACTKRLQELFDLRKGGITELRGFVFDGPFGHVLASVHPSFLTRTWIPWWPLLRRDMVRARQWHDGSVTRPLRLPILVTSPAHADREAADLVRFGRMAVDTEIRGDGTLSCIAFAAKADEGITFPLPAYWAQAQRVLDCEGEKVFQNAQFDLTKLRQAGFAVRNATHDTMLLWHACEPLLAGKAGDAQETQKSLRFLASIFTWDEWWKDYRFASPEEQWKLCARDAAVTFEVCHRLLTGML